MAGPQELTNTPIHLDGVDAVVMTDFDGSPAWFERYSEAHPEAGFLVTSFAFDQPWDSWEMHPAGDEIVLCVAGSMTLHQETAEGESRTVTLGPGEYVVNEPGTWHTADVDGSATGVFITAGEGTQHRPR